MVLSQDQDTESVKPEQTKRKPTRKDVWISFLILYTASVIAVLDTTGITDAALMWLWVVSIHQNCMRDVPLDYMVHLPVWLDTILGVGLVILFLFTGHYILATLAASATIVDIFNR